MIELGEVPYGSWKSKITAEMVVEESVRLNHVRYENGKVYWEEMNPAQKGRVVLVMLPKKGKEKNLLPEPYSARTRINEYGGCSYCVGGEKIFFINQKDQCIYQIDEEQKVAAITQKENVRYGDLLFDARSGAAADCSCGRGTPPRPRSVGCRPSTDPRRSSPSRCCGADSILHSRPPSSATAPPSSSATSRGHRQMS